MLIDNGCESALFLSENAEESALECAGETAKEYTPTINLKQSSQRLISPNFLSSSCESDFPQYPHFI